ncbi:hypothetical protein [Streptomyces sp. UH6]|uniref:hypothetical protein n=1 Tax=Streptomyces sp. UH6 TaxID=2748379 RepID=UPI00280B5223|nr:hypothetical protein [Streptomyces sp. UH6]
MTGSTPPWKRRPRKRGADPEPPVGSNGARDVEERGPHAVTGEGAPLEPAGGGLPAPAAPEGPAARRRAAARLHAALGVVTDRMIATAPRIPVRDLNTLRKHFPGLGPEEIADRLVAGAARATATVGAGVGAVNMLPVPPAMATSLATEITGVAAVELKLVAELHEIYGQRPPGDLRARSTAYLTAWTSEHGVTASNPATLPKVVDSGLKQALRRQIKRRLVRNVPNLLPFLLGAAVGAVINRRDTRRFAEHIREDLRKAQVPWERLEGLPPLEKPSQPLALPEIGRWHPDAAPGHPDPAAGHPAPDRSGHPAQDEPGRTDTDDSAPKRRDPGHGPGDPHGA